MSKPDTLEVTDIPLFSPGQAIDFHSDSFQTGSSRIGEIGYAHVSGDKAFEFAQDRLGFTVIENRLVIERAQTLVKRGFYDSEVFIFGAKLGNTVNITMMLPDQRMAFEASETMARDEFESDPTRMNQTYALTNCWRMPHSSLEFAFFAPPDPIQLEQFLSELRFSFRMQPPFTERPTTRRSVFSLGRPKGNR